MALSALLLKLLLVPALIAVVTLAARRWGPRLAGWLSAFPLVAGPILIMLTLEQGDAFGAQAAEGTVLAVLAILVFVTSYAHLSARFGVFGAMSLALLAYALTAWIIAQQRLPLGGSFAIVLGALLLTPRLLPRVEAARPAAGARDDLPWRMAAGATLVLLVTLPAAHLGPRASGLLAMFPVMSTVLIGFSHASSGRAYAVQMLRGMIFGYYAFAAFGFAAALALPHQGVLASFISALVAALLVQALAMRFVRQE